MITSKHKFSKRSADYSNSKGVFFLSMIPDGPPPHLVYHRLPLLGVRNSSKRKPILLARLTSHSYSNPSMVP
ncbi:hypothetical protein EUGRSUZ_B01801 [Eucalyptus grandis]|uniref:Uncharacterized protein n=2 Tax=Eucalyptus grandis TaxID=71139 RepID=A0ACC3LRE0_EUCGR|nr:hypothetical protein EUGRSUZ_B01801 [Eucalyptus grandis]